MEVVSEHAHYRTELEEKVKSMKAKKVSLLADIASLKGRIAALEKCANTLEAALQTLRMENAESEEKASTYDAEAVCDLPPSTAEELPVWP